MACYDKDLEGRFPFAVEGPCWGGAFGLGAEVRAVRERLSREEETVNRLVVVRQGTLAKIGLAIAPSAAMIAGWAKW